jgi:hypothetical protein
MDHMAIDQYGQTYHSLGKHPRKALLDKLCRKHASKMYIDSKDGKAYHVGYIIGGLWLSVYSVTPMRKAV